MCLPAAAARWANSKWNGHHRVEVARGETGVTRKLREACRIASDAAGKVDLVRLGRRPGEDLSQTPTPTKAAFTRRAIIRPRCRSRPSSTARRSRSLRSTGTAFSRLVPPQTNSACPVMKASLARQQEANRVGMAQFHAGLFRCANVVPPAEERQADRHLGYSSPDGDFEVQ
jgi:hypothetical protein